jgi:hypothetical protein
VTGEENDRGDNVAKELQIMHALLDAKGRKSSVGKLEAIYPILVGQPRDPIDELYPGTNNFYRDGSAQAIIEGKLVERPSPPTNRAVEEFLSKQGIPVNRETRQRTIMSTVSTPRTKHFARPQFLLCDD